jgi:phosphatidate cytidylyltransferase
VKLPQEIWLRMVLLVGIVLVGWSVPLGIFSLVRLRIGKEIRSMWLKYSLWFIMVPVIIIPMFFNKLVVEFVFLALSLYSFEEYARAVGLWKEQSYMWVARICVVLIYVTVMTKQIGAFMSMPAYIIMFAFLYPIFRDTYKGMIQRSVLLIFGVIYFGWFLGHLAFLMNVPTGRQLILAFMLIVITNDASAYVIGSTFGRHKMVPNLSPNKTWEGAIGALLISIGVTIAIRFALYDMSPLMALGLGAALGFGGACGDLTLSLIKRDVQIKDSGHLIPGHGGLLDRLNSILFVSPIFFHFMNAFYITEISLGVK